MKVPVRIVVGAADPVAPAATNAQRFAALIGGAKLTILPGAVGHHVFLDECNEHGKAILPICRDAEGVDRAAVHAQVSEMALQFFDGLYAKK